MFQGNWPVYSSGFVESINIDFAYCFMIKNRKVGVYAVLDGIKEPCTYLYTLMLSFIIETKTSIYSSKFNFQY